MADQKISEMTPVGSLGDSDEAPYLQGGQNVRATNSVLQTRMMTNPVLQTDLNANGKKLVDVAAPTASNEVGDRAFNDERYLPKDLGLNATATGQYTLVAADNGKLVTIDTNLVVPAGLGQSFSCEVFLDNATKQTLDLTAITTKKGNPEASITGDGIISVTMLNATTVLVKGETEA